MNKEIYMHRPKEDGDIPMTSPARRESVSGRDSRTVRRLQLGNWIAELTERGVDYGAVLTLEQFELVLKVVIRGESLTSTAKELGVSDTTVGNWVYGTKNSIYSKIKYWIGRM